MDKNKQAQLVEQEVERACAVYVDLTNRIDEELRARIVKGAEDIPPQVAQAIWLGVIARCAAEHMAILPGDLKQWAAGAMQNAEIGASFFDATPGVIN